MSITIRRSANPKGVTRIPNDWIQDPAISLKAKGVLGYLFTLPENQPIYKKDLQKKHPGGRYALDSAIKELLDAGYIATNGRGIRICRERLT